MDRGVGQGPGAFAINGKKLHGVLEEDQNGRKADLQKNEKGAQLLAKENYQWKKMASCP